MLGNLINNINSGYKYSNKSAIITIFEQKMAKIFKGSLSHAVFSRADTYDAFEILAEE